MKIGKSVFIVALTMMTVILMSNVSDCAQTVRLATINWEPYTGEHLPADGFLSEIVTEAFKRVGYKTEFFYRPWKRALEETKRGIWHGLMDTYYLEDRKNFLEFSDPVWTVELSFFALNGNPAEYTSLPDIAPYLVGVLRGVSYEKELQAAGIRIEKVTSVDQNINKLLEKRIDLTVYPKEVFLYYLKRDHSQEVQKQVTIVNPPFKKNDVYVTFSKKNPEYQLLTTEFNKGLSIIKNDGTLTKILRKHDIISE